MDKDHSTDLEWQPECSMSGDFLTITTVMGLGLLDLYSALIYCCHLRPRRWRIDALHWRVDILFRVFLKQPNGWFPFLYILGHLELFVRVDIWIRERTFSQKLVSSVGSPSTMPSGEVTSNGSCRGSNGSFKVTGRAILPRFDTDKAWTARLRSALDTSVTATGSWNKISWRGSVNDGDMCECERYRGLKMKVEIYGWRAVLDDLTRKMNQMIILRR